MTPAHVVVRRVVSGAYSSPSIVGWYGVKVDAARVIEDADQNMGHRGPYVVAGHEMCQTQAIACAEAILRSDRRES